MTAAATKEAADRVQTIRQHFIWQEKVVAASDLSPMLRLVAMRLALFRNSKSGRCFVGYQKLADSVGASGRGPRGGMKRRSAMRAVAELEQRGWLKIERGGGRGHANEFRFLLPPETVTPQSPFTDKNSDSEQAETVTGDAGNGDRGSHETVTPRSPQYCFNNVGGAEAPANTGECDVSLARNEAPPGAGRHEGGAPEAGEGQQAKDGFAALATIWQRPFLDDEAEDRRAYAWARTVADQETIIAGALTWRAAFDNPRYLPPLAKWLTARGWEKPPPEKPPPQRRQQRSKGGKVDMASMLRQQGRST